MNDNKARTCSARSRARPMLDRGLEPDFPADAVKQLQGIPGPRPANPSLRSAIFGSLLWCSIDNDSLGRTWTTIRRGETAGRADQGAGRHRDVTPRQNPPRRSTGTRP